MSMSQKYLAGCVTVAVSLLANSANADVSAVYWGRPQMRDDVIRLIASKAKPDFFYNIAAGGELRKKVENQCGNIDSVYTSLLRQRNPEDSQFIKPDLTTTKPIPKLLVPKCLYSTSKPFQYRPKAGEDFRTVALKFTGYAGPVTRVRFQEINRGLNLDRLRGRELKVPYEARATRLDFSDSLALNDFETELGRLDLYYRKAPTNRIRRGSVDARVGPVQNNMGKCDAFPSPLVVPCRSTAPDYPVSDRELARVLTVTDAVKSGAISRPGSGVVFLIDTGLVGFTNTDFSDLKTLPAAFGESDLHFYDVEGARTMGENLSDETKLLRPDPIVSEGYFWKHGTHLAGIILGKYRSAEVARLTRTKIKLAAFNAVQLDRTAPICGQAKLRGSLVENGIGRTFYIQPTTKVINLSLSDSQKVALHHLSNVSNLYVVSAGNEELDLDSNATRYPAALGRQDSRYPTMIVVAAHDADNKLLPLTAHGKRTVHIAAPGCGINSLLGDRLSDQGAFSGTSQAAAFVSYTAAILLAIGASDSVGTQLTAREVKDRILLTADRDINDRGKLRNDARLNIHKATAINFDILEELTAEGGVSLQYGVLTEASDKFSVCTEFDRVVDLSELARLDIVATSGGLSRVDVAGREGPSEQFQCSLGENTIEFAAYDGSAKLRKPRRVPLRSVRQLIPGYVVDTRLEQRKQIPK